MVLLYMVTLIINIPQMLAYIPAPWILWVLFPDIFQRNPHENMFPKVVSSHVSVCAIFGNVVSAAVSYCLSVGYIQHCRRPHWGEGDVRKTRAAHISTPKIPLRNQTGQRKVPIFMRNKMNFYLLVVKRCNGTSPISYNQMIFPLKHPFKGDFPASHLWLCRRVHVVLQPVLSGSWSV